MASVNEIRRVAKQVYNARSTVSTKKKRMMSEINGMYSWWDSSASHAFKNRYGGIDRDIQRVMNNLDNLEYQLKQLAKELEEAENAKRLARLRAQK